MKNEFSRAGTALILALAVLVATAIILAGGCSKTLDGELNENQKPIVYFVNIPPGPQEVCDTIDGVVSCTTIVTQFSRNPVVNWVGTDRDGIIAYFRYCVATSDEIDGMNLLAYASGLASSDWIRLDVEPKGPNPQTTNTIAMTADLDDPVRNYVDQYVFLQAFDNEGLGSDIVYRLFSRNDNPPETSIWPGSRPAINGEFTGGIVTGVQIRWAGDDPIDYPSDPPPFEFQWRLYGPYDSLTLEDIRANYFTHVCVTADGQVKRLGEEIRRCDTIFTDSGTIIESCLVCTCAVDMEPPDELAAYVDTASFFDVESLPDSLLRFGDLSYAGGDTDWVEGCGCTDWVRQYKCMAKDDPESWLRGHGVDAWIPQTAAVSSDLLFNVYWNSCSDTTMQMDYIFWIRSRDDALVPDLTPDFEVIPVISPQYERDVIVLDMTLYDYTFWSPVDNDEFNPKAYWKGVIDTWAEHGGHDSIDFDTTATGVGYKPPSPDYIWTVSYGATIADLLKHKIIILYNDALSIPSLSTLDNVFTAVDAGVNLWATWRDPLSKGRYNKPDLYIIPPADFAWYFGVERAAWAAWACYTCASGSADNSCYPCGYYQDFIGAGSKYPDIWPYLPIDTMLLRTRYVWKVGTWLGIVDRLDSLGNPVYDSLYNVVKDTLGGVDQNPALPEVGWSQLRNGTTTIYKYKSSYGQSHPLGFNFAFQGRPCGHVFYTSLFKTAYFTFTPIAIQPDSMQKTIDVLLEWLYNKDAPIPLEVGSAPVVIPIEEARENARRRQAEQSLR